MMHDFATYRKSAIRYWERKRIAYNLALVLPAFLGYGLAAGVSAGVGDQPHHGWGAVLFLFVLSAIGANACFSLGYALEFLFGSDSPDSRWPRFWRPLLVHPRHLVRDAALHHRRSKHRRDRVCIQMKRRPDRVSALRFIPLPEGANAGSHG